jgi:dTDP-4-amino-4,6-dideoxygalactose transaminase
MPDLRRRQALIEHLRQAGILAVFHYVPLHLSTMGRRFGGRPGDCPVTEDISDRLLRLPLYASLSAEQQTRVIARILEFGC